MGCLLRLLVMARFLGGVLLAVAAMVVLKAASSTLFISGYQPASRGSKAAMRNEYIEKNMEEGSKVKEAFKVPYGERGPIPQGYGIRTGLSDLLKPLNSEYGVTAKEDSIPTYIVLLSGIVLLFLFYLLLLLINNQSVLLPPEDEFDEYVANFLPYFFFRRKVMRKHPCSF